MDTQQLTNRYNTIPESLSGGVALFKKLSTKPGVRSVKLLSNFDKGFGVVTTLWYRYL